MSKKKCNDTHKNHKFKLVPNYAYFTGHGALIKKCTRCNKQTKD